MALPLSLAQFRDVTRRYLQEVPAVDDVPAGPVGDPSVSCPDPNNALINTALNAAISMINRIVTVGALTRYQIPVPLCDLNTMGPQYVSYANELLPPYSLTATQITNVVFTDGVKAERLEMYTYYGGQRDYTPFQQYAPARPVQWLLTGSQIGLMPPSATTGTLFIDAAIAIPPLVNDADTVQFLPVDYQDCIPYLACSILSGRQATDVEAMQRGQYFDSIGKQGIMSIVQWKGGFNDDMIQSIRDTLEMVPLSEIKRQVMARGPQQQSQQQSPVGEG